MDVYLVGGAVRDELLGLPVSDRDWVVVGVDPQAMLDLGYTQVGRDFPVFLHPQSHEEYALARTERKSGPGHKGFVVHAGADVTLEQDLARRDITINAIARTPDGVLVDPYGGARDLKQRRLRHVSDAFSEDPLRVLRVARFAAQLTGFSVAEETLELMTRIVRMGGLRELPAERVAQELSKLLEKQVPVAPFFTTLAAVGALDDWLPEFNGRKPQVPAVLRDTDLRYAALHWQMPLREAEAVAARLKVSSRRVRLVQQVCRYGAMLTTWRAQDADALGQVLQELGAFKDAQWFVHTPAVISACAAIDLSDLAQAVMQVNQQVTTASLQSQGYEGAALGKALAAARASALAARQ